MVRRAIARGSNRKSELGIGSKYAKKKKKRKMIHNLTYGDSLERAQASNVESPEEIWKEQRSSHLSMEPEIAKLCEILLLPDNVKSVVEKFLQYTINNDQICSAPVSILQAFQLSLCWTIASLPRHKLDFETSLMLAKRHLNFDCKEDMVNVIKARLWDLKDEFLLLTAGNSEFISSPKASEPSDTIPSNTQVIETSDTIPSNTQVIENVELTEKDISKNMKETQKRKPSLERAQAMNVESPEGNMERAKELTSFTGARDSKAL